MAQRGGRRGRDGGAGRPRRPSGPGRPVRDEARNAAYDVLRAVDERDAYANLMMPRLLHDRGLAGRDAALATELAYGTLRGLGAYDEIIAACSDRPPEEIDPPLLDAVRIGVHQLLRTRVPPHAAVGTTVDLVRLRVGAGPSRYANAVLRKVSTRTLPEWLEIVAPGRDDDPVGHLAVSHSHPRWIVSALRDALEAGEAAEKWDDAVWEETGALLRADNERPRVTLVARPGRATVEELADHGAEPAVYSPYGAYLPEGDPASIPAVAEGRAAVQDEASQLVALALTRVPVTGSDGRWLDMCAGPGGKAGLLDALAAGSGGRLVAADAQPHRARLARQAVREAGVIVADGTRPSWRPGAFDRVLLDAPCTGLGALRRRPEARWRRAPESLPELVDLQRELLASALDSVRPGGVVAYVTCSPHLAETRDVVETVLAGRDDAEPLAAPSFLPEVTGLGDGPYARFWPHRHGTDAMFLALLRRRDPG
ncbi:transcription antitermination factor NusB [Spongiactinospora sp. TRM90649]|uniref:RsmB/NOP family class I SAM-dependent RNA methyltransferase n=1 Tax=Spongiactinospora sp. TRM90649 TaxID=3031114 RepID=UPI0023F8CBF7|nr:transcription antitermination factor NusB [Spongiactinospora sp. TRM90649]MDF5756821.1 transcription antitermination factor NusB [Spongiactinospora sp. TRM90649]